MDMDHELLEKEEREAEEKEEVWEDEQEPHIFRLRIISALFLLNFVKHLESLVIVNYQWNEPPFSYIDL